MKAQDIMTRDVVTVAPDRSIHEIATLMVENHVSGIPVVGDGGKLLGMISQSDLLHRAEIGTERKRKWWFRIFADSDALARDFVKAHGHTANDVMTRYIVSVREDADLRDVADILDKHKIKRVPVVNEGRLVGIITRGDMVRALTLSQSAKSDKKVDNAALHRALQDRIQKQPWINKTYINLTVSDGVVEMWGFVDSVEQHRALRLLVDETDGVTKVEDKIKVGVPYRGGI
jgi:CBS domain-containing protein